MLRDVVHKTGRRVDERDRSESTEPHAGANRGRWGQKLPSAHRTVHTGPYKVLRSLARAVPEHAWARLPGMPRDAVCADEEWKAVYLVTQRKPPPE